MIKRIDPSLIPPSPDLSFEEALWKQGLSFVAGIDEAGRGALAGPVAVGVVVLPTDMLVVEKLKGVRDSKQLSPSIREKIKREIYEVCADCAVGYASPKEIDNIGIVPAIRIAAFRALKRLRIVPEHLLLDYLFLPDVDIPQTSLIKGDQRSLSIASASVLAKTSRDALMRDYGVQFPLYHFEQNKGYGTSTHRSIIGRYGACDIHRKTFRLTI